MSADLGVDLLLSHSMLNRYYGVKRTDTLRFPNRRSQDTLGSGGLGAALLKVGLNSHCSLRHQGIKWTCPGGSVLGKASESLRQWESSRERNFGVLSITIELVHSVTVVLQFVQLSAVYYSSLSVL